MGIRNRVKGRWTTTPNYRSNLFTQDVCDVKCNIQITYAYKHTRAPYISCCDYCPIGENRYGLQHTALIVEDIKWCNGWVPRSVYAREIKLQNSHLRSVLAWELTRILSNHWNWQESCQNTKIDNNPVKQFLTLAIFVFFPGHTVVNKPKQGKHKIPLWWNVKFEQLFPDT